MPPARLLSAQRSKISGSLPATFLGSCAYVLMLVRLGSAFVTPGNGGRSVVSSVCQRRALGRTRTHGTPSLLRALTQGATTAGENSTAEERRVELAQRRAERRSRRSEAIQRSIGRRTVGRAKSVRRAGSPSEQAGIEALLPPQGPPGSGAPALSGLPDLTKPFTVLGIETSCDDTAAAVVSSDGTVLGEAIAGQAEVHEEWGGVVPSLAMEAHRAKMDGVVAKALAGAGMASAAEVDAIAVTVGPGLEICLRIGCEKAKTLAADHEKPFVAVHHLEAHALMARKPLPSGGGGQAPTPPADAEGASSSPPESGGTGAGSPESSALEFPFLGLLVSGGHCQLLLCEGVGRYTVLGGTMDDALGEAYDKAARLLGLKVGGGGGPAVEALALGGDPTSHPLTVPMQGRKDCDFSFAGLKNAFRLAVTRAVEEQEEASEASSRAPSQATAEDRGLALPESTRADLAASFQHTAIRHLEERLRRAMDACEASSLPASPTPAPGDASGAKPGVRSLAVVGGVAANKELRRRLQALCDGRQVPWRMVVPPARLCTDNGVMVAWAGIERLRRGMSNAAPEQGVYARLPLGCASETA